jgi:hypothetical protein
LVHGVKKKDVGKLEAVSEAFAKGVNHRLEILKAP